MSKYAKAVEQLSEAKTTISDVQRLIDDGDMNDIIEILNLISRLQGKLCKRDQPC